MSQGAPRTARSRRARGFGPGQSGKTVGRSAIDRWLRHHRARGGPPEVRGTTRPACTANAMTAPAPAWLNVPSPTGANGVHEDAVAGEGSSWGASVVQLVAPDLCGRGAGTGAATALPQRASMGRSARVGATFGGGWWLLLIGGAVTDRAVSAPRGRSVVARGTGSTSLLIDCAAPRRPGSSSVTRRAVLVSGAVIDCTGVLRVVTAWIVRWIGFVWVTVSNARLPARTTSGIGPVGAALSFLLAGRPASAPLATWRTLVVRCSGEAAAASRQSPPARGTDAGHCPPSGSAAAVSPPTRAPISQLPASSPIATSSRTPHRCCGVLFGTEPAVAHAGRCGTGISRTGRAPR